MPETDPLAQAYRVAATSALIRIGAHNMAGDEVQIRLPDLTHGRGTIVVAMQTPPEVDRPADAHSQALVQRMTHLPEGYRKDDHG